MPWTEEWIEASSTFERLLEDAGATTDSTYAVQLTPVLSTTDDDLSYRVWRELSDSGFTVVARGNKDGGSRLFAYEQPKAASNEWFGTFLWLPVHSNFAAWWLISAWRARQLAHAAHDLLSSGQIVAASACARSLVETAAVIRQDTAEVSRLWEACKQFQPSVAYPLPSSAYKPLHDYLIEMLMGGKFKGEVPSDITALISEPPPRKSIQTPIDRLSKSDPSIARTYDLLCNTVHPSVGGTFSYFSGTKNVGPSEARVVFRQDRSSIADNSEDDFLTTEIKNGIVRGLHWSTVALDDALRICDDIALTTRVCQVISTPYWRAVNASERNSRCVCRSGKKSKACVHEWGTVEYLPPSPDNNSL